MIYEIRTTFSVTYSLLLLLLSASSITTSLILLYQTIISVPRIPKEWTLSITILFAQSIFSFFNSLLTLVVVLRGIWNTCYRICRPVRYENDIVML